MKRMIVQRFDGFFCFGTPSVRYLLALGARPEQILTQHAAVINDVVIRRNYEANLPQRAPSLTRQGFARRNFVYVGRLSPEKNLSCLLIAFFNARRNARQGREWGLLLRGDGPLLEELMVQSQQLGLNSVHFLPGVAWHEVPETLALSDVLVLPSFSEPWGLVVNEAMVCGLPVLVSDRCGCAEDLVRDGENGFKFPPDDVTRLTELLQTMMDHSETTRLHMGQASRRLVRAFSLPVVAEEMRTGFERVASL